MSSKDEKPLAEAMNTTSSSENPEQEKTKSTEPTASTTTNTTTVASDEKEQTKKWEADPWAAFVKGVKVAFKTWDAMQLAIKEQFVLRAEEKAKGIEADVLNLFLGRKSKVNTDDVIDLIHTRMLQDLCTDADDGSAEQIGRMLVQLYFDCVVKKNFDGLEMLIDYAKNRPEVDFQYASDDDEGSENGDDDDFFEEDEDGDDEDDDEDDEGEEDGEDGEAAEGDESKQQAATAGGPAGGPAGGDDASTTAASKPQTRGPNEPDDDGWFTVPKQKKGGKR